MSGVGRLELLLGLLAVAVILALVARRLRVPPAVAYTVGGLVIAVIPGGPSFELEPELALTLFLPPLLQASAFFTNWHLFRSNLRPILLLAVGCVSFTTLVVGIVTHALLPARLGPRASCWAPSSHRRTPSRPAPCCSGCACRAGWWPSWKARAW